MYLNANLFNAFSFEGCKYFNDVEFQSVNRTCVHILRGKDIQEYNIWSQIKSLHHVAKGTASWECTMNQFIVGNK